MVNEYKKIVLLKGLCPISEYHFNMFKSLLASELKLTRKMKDEYDRIQIADLMEEVFQNDAGLGKLIEVFKAIPELGKITDELRKEKLKGIVVRRSKSTPVKGKTTVKKKLQEEAVSTMPTSTTRGTEEETQEAQKRKNTNEEKTGTKKSKVSEEQPQPPCPADTGTSSAVGVCSPPTLPSSSPPRAFSMEKMLAQPQAVDRRSVFHKDPLTVMVLKTTDPFEYETSEGKKNKMFHALVATETGFSQVKVLDINLKGKFTNKKVITLSNYFECVGVLEIQEASSVSEASLNQKFEVPDRVIKRANETPKIDHIRKGASGTSVYGLFTLKKKTVNKKNTVYELQDNTGQIDVLGNGKWYNINCEEGDKLRLFCFQLRRINQQPKLVCGSHSYIKVIKRSRRKKEPVNVSLNLEVEVKNYH